jgi:hypothetical protein
LQIKAGDEVEVEKILKSRDDMVATARNEGLAERDELRAMLHRNVVEPKIRSCHFYRDFRPIFNCGAVENDVYRPFIVQLRILG